MLCKKCMSIASLFIKQTSEFLFGSLSTFPGFRLSKQTKPFEVIKRSIQSGNQRKLESSFKNRTILYYVSGFTVLAVGASYAAVPLYRMFCQATGRGGKAELANLEDRVETMKKVAHRLLTVRFNADTSSRLQWNFRPQQSSISIFPGETALAFYTAKNPTDKPVVGIATYNILPFEAGKYFNKIQCFCFEEQMLNPHEQVDMPVFFYVDPEFTEDPLMETVDEILLSYTFFEAKEGFVLPLPDVR